MLTSMTPAIDLLPVLRVEPRAGGWILLVGPRSLNATLLTLIARLGERAETSAAQPGGFVPPERNAAGTTPAAQPGSFVPPERNAARVIRVLDGGNRFNAYTVARQARGRPEVLERITVSRAFTCYQVLSLLESTPAAPLPFVVLDLLATFYDESVRAAERRRLLQACLTHLQRLQAAAGGVVSIHPPAVPSPVAVELLGLLQSAAEATYFVQPVSPAPEPLRLF